MKKIFISFLAVVVISASSFAQQKREINSSHHFRNQRGMMMKQLNLSEDQKKQAKIYRNEFKQKMQELNKNESISVKEFRDKKYALLKEQKAKMQSLLTTEQKNKLAQFKIDQKAKADGRFAMRLDKMKTNLGLTEDQVSKLKAHRENMFSKFKVIKQNESLSREQKRDQLMALRTESKEQRNKIFTEDQLKKMEEMRKNHSQKSYSN